MSIHKDRHHAIQGEIMEQINTIRSSVTDNTVAVAHQQLPIKNAETKQTPDRNAQYINSVDKAVKTVSDSLSALRSVEPQFSVDDELGELVVKIIDSDTKALIRQMPSEEMLKLSKKMTEITNLLCGETVR